METIRNNKYLEENLEEKHIESTKENSSHQKIQGWYQGQMEVK